MNATTQLQKLGQSIWLDNITRELLDSGTFGRYVRELSVTGLTSNPTIFEKAISGSRSYDPAIREKAAAGKVGEALFVELALEDLARAAALLRPVHVATRGVDGWVSMELSPLLAADTKGSIVAARELHARANQPNLFVKIPGTPEGIPAIEESIYSGVPINVTLLFSAEQYLAAAEAYLRGIERRHAEGRDLRIGSVASLFVSRWDVAANPTLPPELHNRLGIAIAGQAYRAYRRLLATPRWQKLAAAGAQPQRLLWASTGTKDPTASDTLYVSALAAPDTVNTMPEDTLHAFADHGQASAVMPLDGGDADATIQRIHDLGVDTAALAARLQVDGAQAFVQSWRKLLEVIGKTAKSSERSPAAVAQ
jgi:transaldolase